MPDAKQASVTPRAGRRHDSPPGKNRTRWSSYLYVLPAFILVAGVVHAGIGATAYFSLLDWNGLTPNGQFIGLDNYVRMFSAPGFWQALLNTLVYGIALIAMQMTFGFAIALLVRTKTVGRGLVRTLVFVPVVLAPAVVATAFRLLLTPSGEINQIIRWLGFEEFDHAWLADPRTAFAVIISIGVWQATGFAFVIYDAALGQIEPSIIEAASIDGASSWQLVKSVILPMLSGSHLVLVVLTAIGALKTFDLFWLTTAGGPGTSTQILAIYIYKEASVGFRAGYAATVSLVLVALAILFAVLHVRLSSRER